MIEGSTKIEKTEVWITCETPLEGDGRTVRGFFGNLYRNRPEFHNHFGEKLLYRHPLIQYKIFGGTALVVGLQEGAYLLKAVPKIECLEIHHKKNAVIKRNLVSGFVPFGVTEYLIHYSFSTPWIGLNNKNYETYLMLKDSREDTEPLFNKVIIGNLLSMCKGLGYTINHQLEVKSDLRENGTVDVKENTKLMAFVGQFEVNFLIPDFWGIGGKVSLGYGTVRRLHGGKAE